MYMLTASLLIINEQEQNWLTRKQDKMSEWNDVSTRFCKAGTTQM